MDRRPGSNGYLFPSVGVCNCAEGASHGSAHLSTSGSCLALPSGLDFVAEGNASRAKFRKYQELAMNQNEARRPIDGEGTRPRRKSPLVPREASGLAGGLASLGLYASGVSRPLADEPNCGLPTPPQGLDRRRRLIHSPRRRPSGCGGACAEVVADPVALKKLTEAYGMLKALQSTPDSPINWCNQANIHYNHCSFPSRMLTTSRSTSAGSSSRGTEAIFTSTSQSSAI